MTTFLKFTLPVLILALLFWLSLPTLEEHNIISRPPKISAVDQQPANPDTPITITFSSAFIDYEFSITPGQVFPYPSSESLYKLTPGNSTGYSFKATNLKDNKTYDLFVGYRFMESTYSFTDTSAVSSLIVSHFPPASYNHFITSSAIYECYVSYFSIGSDNETHVPLLNLDPSSSVHDYGSRTCSYTQARNTAGNFKFAFYSAGSSLSSYIPDNYEPPIFGSSIILGTDVIWLYNVGSALFSSADVVNEILAFNIGGTNLITLLFTGGFLLYMGWTVVKWFLPTQAVLFERERVRRRSRITFPLAP